MSMRSGILEHKNAKQTPENETNHVISENVSIVNALHFDHVPRLTEESLPDVAQSTPVPHADSKCDAENLKCMYTNTDCLTNKLDELELFLQTEKIDVAAITETLPKNKPNDEKLNFDSVPGYKCLDSQNGRGVCM